MNNSTRISGSISPNSTMRIRTSIPRIFNQAFIKALIFNYRKRCGGRLTDYTSKILPMICRKATTENELQRWHEAVVDLIFKFKSMETYKFDNSREKEKVPGHLMGVMEALVEKAGTVDELRQWAKQVGNYIDKIQSLFYRQFILPIIINKAKTLEELGQWHQTTYDLVMSRKVFFLNRSTGNKEIERYRDLKKNLPDFLAGMRTLEEWLEFLA